MPNEDADPEPWLQEQGVAGGGSGDDSSVVVPTPATAANAGEAAAGVDRFCDAMRGHVRGLDRVAATLLWFLVGHLRRVLAYAPQTRMAARNLAIVFAPGLLRDRAWLAGSTSILPLPLTRSLSLPQRRICRCRRYCKTRRRRSRQCTTS